MNTQHSNQDDHDVIGGVRLNKCWWCFKFHKTVSPFLFFPLWYKNTKTLLSFAFRGVHRDTYTYDTLKVSHPPLWVHTHMGVFACNLSVNRIEWFRIRGMRWDKWGEGVMNGWLAGWWKSMVAVWLCGWVSYVFFCFSPSEVEVGSFKIGLFTL